MPLRSTAFALAALLASALAAPASTVDLPQRETPVPRTTNGVPHIQLGIKADPDLSEKLLGQVGTFPGVTLGPTRVSLPGAVGFQLEDGLPLARQALLDAAGPGVLVDAAGVAANFQRMVRIADSIGIPYDNTASDLSQQIREDLDLGSFASARHSGL